MRQYLAASIHLSDGRVLRIGPDEDQTGDIPTQFSFDTQIPGGFGSASLTIARPPDLYADDAKLFSDVVIYGEGMRVVYEGYVTALPQQSQDEIQLSLTGWSTLLSRISNFRQIFLDRDLSQWQGPSNSRRLYMATRSFSPQYNILAPSIGANSQTEPDLLLELPSAEGGVGNAEAWFDAGPGLEISKFSVDQITVDAAPGFPGQSYTVAFTNAEREGAIDWESTLATYPTATFASGEVAFNVSFTGPITFIPPSPTRFVYIRYFRNSIPAAGARLSIRGMRVVGNHQLLMDTNNTAILGSEAIAYLVGPTPLNVFPESIENSEFPISHLSFLSDISLREAIERINVLGGRDLLPNDWGVYENREFFWRSPGTYGRTWLVSRENLSNVRSDGPDSSLRTAGVKVNYQNPAGSTKSVGPPDSFSDTQTTQLLSNNPENPAYKLPGYVTENVGITTEAGAINIGKVILNERNRLNWRGDLEIQGQVTDLNGKTYPVHQIRAGDQIIVQDDDDKRPRPVNSTTYSHDNLSLTASLGAVPDRLDTLLARLAAVTDLFV